MSDLKNNNNGLKDWQLMRQLDDPELQKELDDTELKIIKERDVRFNKDIGAWTDQFYKKYSMQEAYKIRAQVRKEAGKFIRDTEKLNSYMRAKSYDEYKAGPYEKILIRLKDPDYQEKKSKVYNHQPVLPGLEKTPPKDIEAKSIKSTEDIIYENLLRKEKIQKAQQDDEVNNQGLGTLKKYI
jgi:hypothetical protein